MTLLQASGRNVGLPAGQMGNSEVGHMTIGSGTIVKQDLVRIGDAIEDGSFDQNTALLGAVRASKKANRPLQVVGLVSASPLRAMPNPNRRLKQRHSRRTRPAK